MTEPTQADKTTLDRACTEWCMGEPSIAYQIMADYRIQARREALEEAARGVESGCGYNWQQIAAAIRNLARFPTAPQAGKSES